MGGIRDNQQLLVLGSRVLVKVFAMLKGDKEVILGVDDQGRDRDRTDPFQIGEQAHPGRAW